MLIKTFDGTKAERENCRKIKGKFYEMNRQCFFMPDGKWHRINNGKIVKNHRTGKFVFISNELTEGIIDNKMTLGYYSKDLAKEVEVINNGLRMSCIDRNVLRGLNAEEDLASGEFYIENEFSEDLLKLLKQKNIRSKYNLPFNYRCDSLLGEVSGYFNKYFKGSEFKHSFYKYLPNVTFGVEYETGNGRISQDLMLQNGLIPVRDGSIANNLQNLPYEYATIILKGKTGLQAIKSQCNLLKSYCVNYYRNSLHVHIGNIPISKEYIYSLYLIGISIEKELYKMFPKALIDTSSFKRRSYCNPLRKFRFKNNDLENNFNKIFNYLAMDDELEFEDFKKPHPEDINNKAKWNIETRYHLINFVTAIFGKNQTIEFRIHTPTFNEDKIVNWLYITSAICNFAYENKDDISKKSKISVSIKDIMIDQYKDKSNLLYEYLYNYIEYRKDLMNKHESSGDTIGKLDVENDNLNNFNFKIKSLIE